MQQLMISASDPQQHKGITMHASPVDNVLNSASMGAIICAAPSTTTSTEKEGWALLGIVAKNSIIVRPSTKTVKTSRKKELETP